MPDVQSDSVQLVDVCICTYRRPTVVETLCSVAAQSMPGGVRLRVVVVDNDAMPSAQAIVLETAGALGLACRYVHAPGRNISIARNAALDAADAALVAFIDDDEVAAPTWIAALLAKQGETGAQIVLGPVRAVYGDGPAWLRQADLHSIRPVIRAGGVIETGYTSNVLLARSVMTDAMLGSRFDLALGRTGGEDTCFFARLHALGARIAFADDALAHEAVPPHRAWLGWLLKRSFRSGQTHAQLLAERRRWRPWLVAVAAAKCAYCAAGVLCRAPSPARWRAFAVRTALHAGVVSRLIGVAAIRIY
jgi:succinoglycan biosynthesis protein ExoM